MEKKKSSNSEELYGELGRAFNFTHSDLEANRAGFISKRQQKLLLQELLRRVLTMLIPLSISFLVAFTYIHLTWDAIKQANFVGFLLTLPFILLFPLILIFTFLLVLNIMQDKSAIRVRSINQLKGNGSLSPYKKKTLQQIKFEQTLRSQNNLRVYVAPRSKIILSLEIVIPEQD